MVVSRFLIDDRDVNTGERSCAAIRSLKMNALLTSFKSPAERRCRALGLEAAVASRSTMHRELSTSGI